MGNSLILELPTSCFKIERTGVNKHREALTGYLFIAPLFLGLAVLFLYAFGQNIFLSFNDVGVFGERTFVGLENFRDLLQDPVFKRAL